LKLYYSKRTGSSEGSVPYSVLRLVASTADRIAILILGLIKLVPKYAGAHGSRQ
jgi:hypothetical protein